MTKRALDTSVPKMEGLGLGLLTTLIIAKKVSNGFRVEKK